MPETRRGACADNEATPVRQTQHTSARRNTAATNTAGRANDPPRPGPRVDQSRLRASNSRMFLNSKATSVNSRIAPVIAIVTGSRCITLLVSYRM